MWPEFSAACIRDVSKLLRSGKSLTAYRANASWGVNPQKWSNVYAFEREMEKAYSVKHAVACNSGTMALTTAIKALGLPKGSHILTSPYSFSATPASILLAGHVPQFADIDACNFCLSAKTIKAAITKKTKAILTVDLFGYLQDYSQLREFGLPIVQDACQSQGAQREGKHLHGDIACGSGNGGKNAPCGEAGWAYTNNTKYADRMRHYINHGCNFGDLEVGVNGRMHELVAILARHGLLALEERNQRRRELANTLLEMRYYHNDLHRVYWGADGGAAGSEHVFYVAPFLIDGDRSRFIKRMARHGIPVQAGYTQPLHTLPAFRKYQTTPLPVVEEVHKRLVLLTCLTPDRPLSFARTVAKAIRESLP